MKYSRKKTGYKKYHKRAGKPKSIKREVAKLSKKVTHLQKEQELKHVTAIYTSYDNSTATTTLAYNNPYILLLNGLQRGTSYVQRLGDTVRGTSIDLRGQVFVSTISNVGGIDIPVRFMVIRMKRPEGSPLLLTSYPTITAGTTPMFPKNASGKYVLSWEQPDIGILSNHYFQYKRIYDKVHRLSSNGNAYWDGTHPQSINPYFNFHIKCKINTISDYSRANNGDITDIESNAYYLVVTTDTNSQLTLLLNSVFYFKDA